MKSQVLTVAFLALLFSCQTKPSANQSSINVNTSKTNSIDKDTITSDKTYKYDPLLRPLDSLNCEEAYRFILWRSMHYTKVSKNLVSSGEIVITIFKTSEQFKLDYFIYDNKYEKSDTNLLRPIPISLNHKLKTISENNWLELLGLIKESNFWSLAPTEEKNIVDGSAWSFSGFMMPEKTHSISRLSPSKQSKIFKLGELFVRLSGEDIGELR